MTTDVLVLTQDDCAFCDHAREVLERLSEEFDLQVRLLDIGGELGTKLAAQGGILFAPGIFVAGEAFSYGRLSERKLRRRLNELRGLSQAVRARSE